MQSFKEIVIKVFRILFGLVSIGVGAVWIYLQYSYIINSHEHVYAGYVPEHYGIFDPEERWARWHEFITTMDLYFSLLFLVGGICLVSFKRWGTHLAWIAYGILLIGVFIH